MIINLKESDEGEYMMMWVDNEQAVDEGNKDVGGEKWQDKLYNEA